MSDLFLPTDLVIQERLIREKIKSKFESVPNIGIVHVIERSPSTDEEDLFISTVPDPISPSIRRTRIIEIGIPTVRIEEYTGDKSVQITYNYPITYDMEVVDKWDTSVVPLEFDNSSDLFIANYLRASELFIGDRTFGYANCSHEYLQQNSTVTSSPDEQTGGELHSADWSLTVRVTWVKKTD